MLKLTLLFLTILANVLYCEAFNSHYSENRDDKNALEELEKYIEEQKSNVNQRYRLEFHVSAPIGWINDPNGFSIFNDDYHLFYQYYPYSSEWGPMHWGHVRSRNLVDWEYLPTALLPGKEYCYSGSAVDNNGTMTLIYTGHVNTDDAENPFNENQNIATSSDGIYFQKYDGNPVITGAEDGVDNFRDPKVWHHEDYWYMLVGSSTIDRRGRVVLYRSSDLFDWEYQGVMVEGVGNQGYVWECPDFVYLNNKHVLILSPQGVDAEGDRFKNYHNTVYLVGNLNYDSKEFKVDGGEFRELDYGHDFYATQTVVHKDGRTILVAWFGMWNTDPKEQVDGWAGAITLPRELTLNNGGNVLMKPLRELEILREKVLFDDTFANGDTIELESRTVEIIIDSENRASNVELEFVIDSEMKNSVRLWYEAEKGMVTIDRADGDPRVAPWKPEGNINMRIFIDVSSIEVFCGEGEVVFSSRIYPDLAVLILKVEGQAALNLKGYSLRRSVPV